MKPNPWTIKLLVLDLFGFADFILFLDHGAAFLAFEMVGFFLVR